MTKAVFSLVIGVMLASFYAPSTAYGAESIPNPIFLHSVGVIACNPPALTLGYQVYAYDAAGKVVGGAIPCGTIYSPGLYQFTIGEFTLIETDARFAKCNASCTPLGWAQDSGFIGSSTFTVSAGVTTPEGAPAGTPDPGTTRTRGIELEGDDGEMYCVRIVRGEMTSTPGRCSDAPTSPPASPPAEQSRTPEPDASLEPDAEPVATSSGETISPESSPASPSAPGLPETGLVAVAKNNPWHFAIAMVIFTTAGALALRKYLSIR